MIRVNNVNKFHLDATKFLLFVTQGEPVPVISFKPDEPFFLKICASEISVKKSKFVDPDLIISLNTAFLSISFMEGQC